MFYLDINDNKRLEQLFNKLAEYPDSIDLKNKIYVEIIQGGYEDTVINSILQSIDTFKKGNEDPQLRADILSSIILYGASPDEYFEFGFDKLNHYGRREYFCDKQRFVLFHSFYDFDRYETIRNKWNQYELLKKYYKRDCVHLSVANNNYEEFDSFIREHDAFVVKPVRAYHGDGVRIIHAKDKNSLELYDELRKQECICDELIIQVDFFKQFHENSVNTIRVLAIRRDGNTVILHPQLHIGRGASVADNDIASIRANVDVKTGIVYTPGYDHFMTEYIMHPDTNVQIVGVKIPQWNNLLSDIQFAMEELENLAGYIGFDMALTVKGWVVVEINPFPQCYSQQLVDRMGYRREIEEMVKS